jgi:hypothetical protein
MHSDLPSAQAGGRVSARPIITGRLYRVRTMGQCFDVVASSGCAAIVIALDMLSGVTA